MKAGKLPAEALSRLLAQLRADPRVLIGPGIGLDAAAIDMGDGRVLVATSDPITFATDEIGRYSVHVNANDVACLGATPVWFMATVLLPEESQLDLAEAIFEQIRTTCEDLGIVPIGGHTEVTAGLVRPIIAGAMLGETTAGALVRPESAQSGDQIILTKGIAIEGTAVIAREVPDALRARGVSESVVASAALLLEQPGISIVRDAQIACAAAKVHALHDPTEGGLSTALLELSQATGCAVNVRRSDITILTETRSICSTLALDPLGLLASGALLIVVGASECDELRSALASEGIQAACIGELAAVGSVAIIDQDGHALPRFERDEVARFFDTLGE